MKLLYFSRLLVVSVALLLSLASAHNPQYSKPKPTTTAEPTTTVTTTEYATVTQTSTSYETKTRELPCPPSSTGILTFDDLPTTGVSPMPLIYQDFSFSGSAGWQYFTSNAFASTKPEYRGVHSHPNGLLSRSSGLVSFGSSGRGFSFDITSVALLAFADDGLSSDNDALLVEVVLRMADGYAETLFFEVPNGAADGAVPVLLEGADLNGFVDLVEVAVAVWQSYDYNTGEGNPAAFVVDDLAYVKRTCGAAHY